MVYPSTIGSIVEGFFCHMEVITKKRLILASTSPRRIALLKLLGYRFDIIPHSIDEYIPDDATPEEVVLNLAFMKAHDVAGRVEDAIIIGADTLVYHKKGIIGKPKDIRDAKKILSLLSNSAHSIFTGVCIIDKPSQKKLLRNERTQITMKHIPEEELEAYVQSGEPMDKAGAYAIQGEGEKFIKQITGSYSNAVGLPLGLVQEMLNKFNYHNEDAEKF
ncbi:MAG: septum formation protein [Candidatus Brocadia fulgida]|uniref:dTTP/UTP pyrophosphatase n=1 Tax=Candidatus Brocadia fulgida TaxID=380242 RepID=A0A0M2UWM0_9BACT|nr:MAG: septum formation protein [Candidatus Brocadia fulgida]